MSLTDLRLAYVPLTDAAPLIVAQELGFAAEEGLNFDLIKARSWAHSRDLLGLGQVEAAQMLVPLPIAQAMGLGPDLPLFDLVMVLSVGGQAIVVSTALADKMRKLGHSFAFDDPLAARSSLIAALQGAKLRVGVPFVFSTQAELVRRWLDATDLGGALVTQTVPPPLMADALAAGDVDAFCVGEPWASHAVEQGVGTLLLAGRAIWAAPPEKGLVMTRAFTSQRPDETGRIMRAVWRACRWLDFSENRSTAAEILSRPAYLDLPPELCERGLLGRFHVSAAGELRYYPDFIRFHAGGANFPWRSLAALFAQRIARQNGLDETWAMAQATGVFRTDLYRAHLRSAGADLPGASAKIEGAMAHVVAVASEKGQMILGPDAFFDGQVFDPDFPAR